ncbi:MAG: GNAT family N-acetyltransferase [Clostridiales bacterium]|nr:GNAT family N-acetyltransferase [Clostridiales bacterium]
MLCLMPTNDKELLNSLSKNIFGCEFNGDVGFVLYKEDKAIGIAKIYCAPEASRLISLGILPSERKQGFGDFFTRSLLSQMSLVSSKVIIEYANGYYKKFGFVEKEGKMEIDSQNIVFPCACKKGV